MKKIISLSQSSPTGLFVIFIILACNHPTSHGANIGQLLGGNPCSSSTIIVDQQGIPSACLLIKEDACDSTESDQLEGVEAQATNRGNESAGETSTQSDDFEEAERLGQQIAQFYRGGRFRDAIPLAERELSIYKKLLEPHAPAILSSSHNLAVLYTKIGDYEKAERLFQETLALKEKVMDPWDPYLVPTLNWLASIRRDKGDYKQAEQLYRRALEIRERDGQDRRGLAGSLSNLGSLYRVMGKYGESRKLLERAVELAEKVLKPQDPDLATFTNNLALLYKTMGDYKRAEEYYTRALTIQETALRLHNLGELYRTLGKYDKAQKLFDRSLAISEKDGQEHPQVASTLYTLGLLYAEKGDYERAREVFQRSLDISKKLGSPLVALNICGLGMIYQAKGDYNQAEEHYRKAMEMDEKISGEDHPDLAVYHNNLAMIYQSRGDYGKAEELYLRAVKMIEKSVGTENQSYATYLDNLALIYQQWGNYNNAEPLHRRVLAIRERVFGTEHPEVAISLYNLGALYSAKGAYTQAEQFHRRALAIRAQSFGETHPYTAISLNALGRILRAKGNHTEAEQLLERSLVITKKALGENHPFIATSLNNLAELSSAKGDLTRAVQLRADAAEIEEHNLVLIFQGMPERQRLSYMSTLNATTFGTISLHARDAPKDIGAARLALTTILRRKGRVLDSLTTSLDALRRRLDPEDQARFNELNAVRSQFAAKILNIPAEADLARYQTEVASLAMRGASLDAEISARSPEFRNQSQSITLQRVQQAIPEGAVLVEMMKYKPLNTKASKETEIWGADHYIAYVLTHEGEPQWVDLGEAEMIDTYIASFLYALRDEKKTNTDVKQVARSADEKLMKPIRKLLGDKRMILISPDGPLNLIPFGALVDEQDHYLLETYSFTYLTSGRDLLRWQENLPSKQAPLIIANPEFGPHRESADQDKKVAKDRITGDCSQMGRDYFKPLPYSAREALELGKLLPTARVLTGVQAKETAVKEASGPSILHLATHGFFHRRAAQPASSKSSSNPANFSLELLQTACGNPLLRSGLALAGANQSKESNVEDGLLTAFEALGLDLWGTKLVVLSACGTGFGDIWDGEGVYGLRRALVLAGSESQVMSLWQADDETTKDMMVSYYKRLIAGGERGEALRQVQLEMIRSEGQSNPRNWASFIQLGQWTRIAIKPGQTSK